MLIESFKLNWVLFSLDIWAFYKLNDVTKNAETLGYDEEP